MPDEKELQQIQDDLMQQIPELGGNQNKMLNQKQTQMQLSRKQMYWKYCFMLSPLFEIGGIFSPPSHSHNEEQKESDGRNDEMKTGVSTHYDNKSV